MAGSNSVSGTTTTLSDRIAALNKKRRDEYQAKSSSDRFSQQMKNRRGAEPTTKKDRRTIVEQSLNKSAGRRGRPGRTSGQADAATTPGTSSKIIKKAIRNVIASKSQSAASPRQSIKAKKPASASGAKKAGSRSRRSGKGTKKPEAKPASKDNLDEDLDSYMMQDEGHAKNKLDADLDDYMGDAPEA